MKKYSVKIIAVVMTLVMACSFFLTACGRQKNNSIGGGTIGEEIELPEIVLPENATYNTLSYTYASISLDLMSYGYDVFNAYVETENGKEYGIAYTDYEDGYQFEGDEKTYIESGFLAFSADESVSDSKDILYAQPVDDHANAIQDDTYGYIISCVEAGIPSGHFIADDRYTVYSVMDGKVEIETYENKSENYDLSLGKLYDYDKQDIVYVPFDEIDSSPIEFVPLTESIDYEVIKTNLYEVIEEQQAKGYAVQTITISLVSVDTLNALYGLLAQGDSLNGYSFEELNSIEFDSTKQYIHFNEDGSITLKDLPPMPVTEYKSLFDWLVDALVLVGAGAIAIVSVTFLGPAGGIIAGAVLGAGIEYFSETVLQGKKFSEVNWSKVLIMGISGALGAMVPCGPGIMPYLAAGAIGGLTSGALTAVDGGSWQDILISAGTGALTAMLMHGLFSSCFPAGTQVLTQEGYLPIELVTVGMMVASYNLSLNKMEWKPVLETYTNTATALTKVTFSNGDFVFSTTNHPYYVLSENRYVAAENLESGDILLSTEGELYVVSVENIVLDSTIVVYNLNVRENHNYFVCESSVLVHNKCGLDNKNCYNKAVKTLTD